MKTIKNFPGYMVTEEGRIWSIAKSKGRHNGKFLVLSNSHNGYLLVNLYCNKKMSSKRVHRLVAEAFIENPERKAEVNHKNGDKKDNKVHNLEWCSSKENKRHAIKNLGSRPWLKASLMHRKLSISDVKQIRAIYGLGQKTQKQLAKKFGISSSAIWKIVHYKCYIEIPPTLAV